MAIQLKKSTVKKSKKAAPNGVAHIQSTFNNTIVTVTDPAGPEITSATKQTLKLRFFLTAAGPETQDTDFTWAEFVRRNNDELVATWGNLANRTLQSAFRNYGAVPSPGTMTLNAVGL